MSPDEVTLPPASPTSYLRWVAFWREVEDRMLASEQLREIAAKEAAPFMDGEVARFISQAAGQIASQATSVPDHDSFTPVITIPPAIRGEVAETIARRAAWLDLNHEALGIGALEQDLGDLRSRVIAAVRAAAP